MDKGKICKYIIRYLSENNYGDIADQLQKESRNNLYCEEYVYLLNFLDKPKEINNYTECLEFLKTKFLGVNNDNITFLSAIYNSFFYQKIFFYFEKYDKCNLISEIQKHLTTLKEIQNKFKNIVEINKIINSQIQNIQSSSKIIFTEKKIELLQFFPEIETIDKLKTFVIDSYHQIKFRNNQKLNKIFYTIYINSLKKCKYHNLSQKSHQIFENKNSSIFSLLNDHDCTFSLIPSKPSLSLDLTQEVSSIVYSNTGRYFIAVLSNYQLNTYSLITQLKNIEIKQIASFTSHHTALITSLSWNKNDTLILTASKDKSIKLLDPFTGTLKKNFVTTHDAMISCAVFTHNDMKFASCGMDYRVNLTDISSGQKEISKSVPGITISEILYSERYSILIAVSATNNSIVFYDMTIQEEKLKYQMNDVIVSCSISKGDGGRFLLINSSKATPVIEMVDLETLTVIGKYFGHRQDRFTIKCNFGGWNENFIVCGSENAKVYVWSKTNSIPISVSKNHIASVNAVIWPHIGSSDIIISCSDDHKINFLVNDNVEKIYFNHGKQLENKIVNIDLGVNPSSRDDTSNITTTTTNPRPNFSGSNLLQRLGSIFRHIGYGSDEENEN